MTNINKLKIGECGKVTHIEGDSPLARRLCALGCIPGTELALVGKAPLGDPLVIKFRGASLAIRRKDASSIFLEV